MFIRKTKISKYTLRIPSPRVTPSNSLTDVEWDNQTSFHRSSILRKSSKKTKYTVVAVTCGLTIAILIVIAIVIPMKVQSTSTTTNSIVSTSSLATIVNSSPATAISVSFTSSSTISVTITTSTNTISTTSKTTTESTTTTTESTTSSTTSETTTTTESTTSSTSSETTTTTESTTSSTTSETTSTTESTTSSTTSETTTTTESTTSSTTSETTTTTESTTSTSSTTTTAFSFHWNMTGETVAGTSGLSGTAADRLNLPTRITMDAFDSLYIADYGNHRIQKYLMNASTGTTVAGTSGLQGSTLATLSNPSDVAVDSNGNIYVADSSNQRVQLWNVGASVGIMAIGTGVGGSAINQFNSPRGITYDSSTDMIYIADRYNHRIISYSPNTSATNIVAGGNGAGRKTTQLDTPVGLVYDSSTNSLIIANYAANNIVRWVLGASNWTLIAGNINGASGGGPTLLYGPFDVTMDAMGNIYVPDTLNDRVQFFPVGSSNGTTIAGTGAPGSNSISLNSPVSIALDSQLNLYVSDQNNHRVQKFTRY